MSYDNPRFKDFRSTPKELVISFAEGNPGALTTLIQLVNTAEKIDPDSALGPFGPITSLDILDCYGSRIWMFYKDVCGHNINMMHGIMRANQMGFTSEQAINRAIDGDKSALDIPTLLRQVKEKLPRFDMGDAL